MNQERIQQKQEAKRIKAINDSLISLSPSAQSEIGVVALQKDEKVFFCGEGIYKKIYTVKPTILDNKKLPFLKQLISVSKNRIRFSMNVKSKDGKLNAFMFMTVFFVADSYYEVREKIAEFEQKVIKETCSVLNINIKECSLEEALTYIHLNSSGEMKKIDADSVFAKKTLTHIFDQKLTCDAGRIDTVNRFGATYLGKNYSSNLDNLLSEILSLDGNYQFVIDFQGFTEEEKELFKYELKNRYNALSINEDKQPLNLSFLLIVLSENFEYTEELRERIESVFDRYKVLLMPGIGREENIFKSSCSLGLIDFHSMQNTNIDTLSNLIL